MRPHQRSKLTAQTFTLRSDDAQAAITTMDQGIDYIHAQRSGLGAVENRLGSAVNKTLFRMPEHMTRFFESMRALGIDSPYSCAEWTSASAEVSAAKWSATAEWSTTTSAAW